MKKNKSDFSENEFIIEVQEKSQDSFKKNKKANKKKNNIKTDIEKEYEKIKKDKRKKKTFSISIFLFVFIIIGVLAGCLLTPTFEITTIIAENGKNVYAGELKKYLKDSKEKNTFLLKLSEAEEKIEEHPYIYDASILRIFPDKLKIEYVEREPYVFIKHIESYFLMDRYGYLLEIKKENTLPELPIIYGLNTDGIQPGEKIKGLEGLKFENIIYLLETAKNTKFNYTISEINYTDVEEIKLSIKEMNIEIIYGIMDKEILSDKVSYLNEILKKLENKKGTLDISSENYSEKVIFKEILK